MSVKYDIEAFVSEMIGLVQAGLPAKITAINAEKADAYSIDQVATADYFQDMDNQVLNANTFVYYSLIDVNTETVGAQSRLETTLQIAVIFDNTNQSGTIEKALRYSRCLREVVQDSFKSTAKASQLKVTEFLPTSMQTNEGADFKVGGIHVTTSIVG